MLPKHLKKVREERKAIAPYNFVELPYKVVEAEPPPNHDCYDPKRNTGRIECTLTTSSPLYIRCGWTPEDFAKIGETSYKDLSEVQRRERADFFSNPASQQLIIPGSSLRGMLRALVEIISFGKIERVSDQQRFFFRAVAAKGDDPTAEEYKKYVNVRNIKAGYLEQKGDEWFIRPARTIDGLSFVWVKERQLDSKKIPMFIKMDRQDYLPQYIQVSFEKTYKNKNNRYFAENISTPSAYPKNRGLLVTSGNMKQGYDPYTPTPRSNHCIVLEATQSPTRLRIDNVAIEHYCNALTDFQKSKPFNNRMGVLEEGRPIFYCQPQSGKPVTLFGQSPNFRIPYSPQGNGQAASAVDFIPDQLKNSEVTDLTDAIFGSVKDNNQKEGQQQAHAGRIFISDGTCEKTASDDVWLSKSTIKPKILASPKATTFQHYLVQTISDKKDLKHYASQPERETVIRGHKLYWHKGQSPTIQHENPDEVSDTQKTEIKPIKPGISFHFTIHFENLSDVELGVILWVLEIAADEQYRLSLGMGKPLGMGAVKITHELHLSARQQRYEKLFYGNHWDSREQSNSDEQKRKLTDCLEAFQNYTLNHISETDHPSTGRAKNLKDVPRIKMLLAMLSWSDSLNTEQTSRYMEIERDKTKHHIGRPAKPSDKTVNEYKERPVLPTPLQVMGITDDRRVNHSASFLASTAEGSAVEKPRKKLEPPKTNSNRGQSEGGGSTSQVFARPPKQPKR